MTIAFTQREKQVNLESSQKKREFIPDWGKKQVDLSRFRWRRQINRLFCIFLPCSGKKPYFKSVSHSYFHKKIAEYLPAEWHQLLQICTISEIIGIIPEDLENRILVENRHLYGYEHYPKAEEGDILRTRQWLSNFIEKYEFPYNYAYLTSKTFRAIADIPEITLFPSGFNPQNPVLEFRRTTNIKQIFDSIVDNYVSCLAHRYRQWRALNNRNGRLIEVILKEGSLTYQDLRNYKFKSNWLNINLFNLSQEGCSAAKGIFVRKDKELYSIIRPLINIIQE